MKRIFRILFIISLICAIKSCEIKNKKEFKKEFYPSGKLKTYGWYINDSIPIDTLYTFYEKGGLSGMDIFDTLGNYIKAVGYYKNGNVNELINYKRGLANGFRYHFYENGQVKKKVFYYNDLSVGDAFFYDKKNNIVAYNFYDWKNHNLNLIEYDSLSGRELKNVTQTIFIDSLRPYNDTLNKTDERSYDLLCIISNPHSHKTVVKINYLSKNGNLMKSDSCTNEPYFFKKEILSDSLFSINILGSQFDSMKNKTVFQKNTILLKYRE